jgi:hypothetical protein
MKRLLVGALALVISLFFLAGNLAVQAQITVNQTSEEHAGADEKEEPALRSSNSQRNRVRSAKARRFIGHKFNFSVLAFHHHEASLLKVFTAPPDSPPANTRRQLLQVFRI